MLCLPRRLLKPWEARVLSKGAYSSPTGTDQASSLPLLLGGEWGPLLPTALAVKPALLKKKVSKDGGLAKATEQCLSQDLNAKPDWGFLWC